MYILGRTDDLSGSVGCTRSSTAAANGGALGCSAKDSRVCSIVGDWCQLALIWLVPPQRWQSVCHAVAYKIISRHRLTIKTLSVPCDTQAAVQLATSLTLPSVIIRSVCTWVGPASAPASHAARGLLIWTCFRMSLICLLVSLHVQPRTHPSRGLDWCSSRCSLHCCPVCICMVCLPCVLASLILNMLT
jgi:hypothetical protein